MCIIDGCKISPSYNFINMKRMYCSKHKLDGMIDLKHKLCEYEFCKKIPCYNYKNEKKGKYCKIHKTDGMINVSGNKCLNCDTIAVFNFKGLKKGIYCSKHKLD